MRCARDTFCVRICNPLTTYRKVKPLPEIYREPLFLLFPIYSSLVSVVAFLLFALPYSLLAWRDPTRLKRFRIQLRRKAAGERRS